MLQSSLEKVDNKIHCLLEEIETINNKINGLSRSRTFIQIYYQEIVCIIGSDIFGFDICPNYILVYLKTDKDFNIDKFLLGILSNSNYNNFLLKTGSKFVYIGNFTLKITTGNSL